MTTTETSRVVFTASWAWWEIVSRDEEIVTDDENACTGRWEEAASLAGTNIDYDDSWVVRVTEVDDRHSAIRPGDYACCDGYGSDVVFVRLV